MVRQRVTPAQQRALNRLPADGSPQPVDWKEEMVLRPLVGRFLVMDTRVEQMDYNRASALGMIGQVMPRAQTFVALTWEGVQLLPASHRGTKRTASTAAPKPKPVPTPRRRTKK